MALISSSFCLPLQLRLGLPSCSFSHFVKPGCHQVCKPELETLTLTSCTQVSSSSASTAFMWGLCLQTHEFVSLGLLDESHTSSLFFLFSKYPCLPACPPSPLFPPSLPSFPSISSSSSLLLSSPHFYHFTSFFFFSFLSQGVQVGFELVK